MFIMNIPSQIQKYWKPDMRNVNCSGIPKIQCFLKSGPRGQYLLLIDLFFAINHLLNDHTCWTGRHQRKWSRTRAEPLCLKWTFTPSCDQQPNYWYKKNKMHKNISSTMGSVQSPYASMVIKNLNFYQYLFLQVSIWRKCQKFHEMHSPTSPQMTRFTYVILSKPANNFFTLIAFIRNYITKWKRLKDKNWNRSIVFHLSQLDIWIINCAFYGACYIQLILSCQ